LTCDEEADLFFLLARIEDSVREDVAELRKSPFIKQGTQIVGLTYDIETGEVAMVEWAGFVDGVACLLGQV
jgi:carbonic anhydrase